MTINNVEIKIWVLRLFSLSWSVLFVLSAYFLTGFSLIFAPLLLLVVAGFFAIGLLFPAMMRHPYHLIERLLAPVGRFFSFLILALVYYGVFTPFAFVLRLIGWDPLRLRSSRRGASAWVERNPAAVDADYRWQY